MRSLSSLAAPAVVLLVGACSVFGTEDPGSQAQEAPPPPPQDPATNANPPVTGAPLVGVFVSSSRGRDEASGNSGPEALKTLGAAIKRAKERGQRVLACAETYTESVVLVDGVSMFGGFDCSQADGWRAGPTRTRIEAPTSPALAATGINLETRVDGFELTAPSFDKEAPSDAPRSSVGAEIRGSARLTIANSILRAGAAGSGKDGVEGATNVENATAFARTGGDATPAGSSNLCPYFGGCAGRTSFGGSFGGTSSCAVGAAGGPGGRGGDGQLLGGAGVCAAIEVRGQPFVATASTAKGSIGYCQDYNSGGPVRFFYGGGDRGANGADGADGTNGTWSLSQTGEFVAGAGTAGKDASPGQGGGGGGGANFNSNCNSLCPNGPALTAYRWSSAGGGGGAGGCAGLAGTPGTGGGASIGALVVDSPLTFVGTRLASAQGGAGGAGTLGSAGLAGANGGATADQGGSGGVGGRGGAAGLSGHGAPGPSIALAYSGQRPSLETSELVPGPGGDGRSALTKAGHVLPAVAGEALAERKF